MGLIENSFESVKSPGFKLGFKPIIHESKRLFNGGGWATAPRAVLLRKMSALQKTAEALKVQIKGSKWNVRLHRLKRLHPGSWKSPEDSNKLIEIKVEGIMQLRVRSHVTVKLTLWGHSFLPVSSVFPRCFLCTGAGGHLSAIWSYR